METGKSPSLSTHVDGRLVRGVLYIGRERVKLILYLIDLGVPLMMDVIRLTSPTHIVRLVPDTPFRNLHPLTDLLPFTPHTLTSTPGILTLPTPTPHSMEVDWYSTNTPGLQGNMSHHQLYEVVSCAAVAILVSTDH